MPQKHGLLIKSSSSHPPTPSMYSSNWRPLPTDFPSPRVLSTYLWHIVEAATRDYFGAGTTLQVQYNSVIAMASKQTRPPERSTSTMMYPPNPSPLNVLYGSLCCWADSTTDNVLWLTAELETYVFSASTERLEEGQPFGVVHLLQWKFKFKRHCSQVQLYVIKREGNHEWE